MIYKMLNQRGNDTSLNESHDGWPPLPFTVVGPVFVICDQKPYYDPQTCTTSLLEQTVGPKCNVQNKASPSVAETGFVKWSYRLHIMKLKNDIVQSFRENSTSLWTIRVIVFNLYPH